MLDSPLTPVSYRVFQRRDCPGLCIAVREGMPIPYFVRSAIWDLCANVREGGSLPLGFQPAPAREASAVFGYNLFHDFCETLTSRHSRRWIEGHRTHGDFRRVSSPAAYPDLAPV